MAKQHARSSEHAIHTRGDAKLPRDDAGRTGCIDDEIGMNLEGCAVARSGDRGAAGVEAHRRDLNVIAIVDAARDRFFDEMVIDVRA